DDGLGREGLLGEGEGVPGKGRYDRGAELDPGGGLARDHEGSQRVEAPRDVRHPRGDESVLLGPPGVRRQRGGVGALAARVADEDADAHPRHLLLERWRHCTFPGDRKSTRLNSSHVSISYAVFCLKKKK